VRNTCNPWTWLAALALLAAAESPAAERFDFILAVEAPRDANGQPQATGMVPADRAWLTELARAKRLDIETLDALPYAFIRGLTEADIDALRRDKRVKGLYVNGRKYPQTAESLALVGQPRALLAGGSGKGWSVAVLDTGADYTHPDLGACDRPGPACRILRAFDTAPDDAQPDADPKRHGTNVAAIIARTAPEAGIVAIDVFNGATADDTDVLRALDWVIANRIDLSIMAVNLSLGSADQAAECADIPYAAAFQLLAAVDVAIVVSAGNAGNKAGLSKPACHPLAIAVGATTDARMPAAEWESCADPVLQADGIPCFSNSAPGLRLLAPGHAITAGGVTLSGTSQAAPHVAAALAALKSIDPDTTAASAAALLAETGRRIVDGNGVAAPRIDLGAATNLPPTARDDSASFLEGGGVVVDVLHNDSDEQLDDVLVTAATGAEGLHIRVVHQDLYVFAEPGVTGPQRVHYEVTDEYGLSASATVRFDVAASAYPSVMSVTDAPGQHAEAISTRLGHHLIWEQREGDVRAIYSREIDAQGRFKGDPWRVTGSATDTDIGEDFSVAADDAGFTVAWTERSGREPRQIRAANFPLPLLGQPYTASFYYDRDAQFPTVSLLAKGVTVGWAYAWNPTRFYAQSVTRNSAPAPIGDLQQLSPNWVTSTSDSATVTTDPDHYILLQERRGLFGLAATRFDLNGTRSWQNDKSIARAGRLFGFDVSRLPDGGFAVAWAHGQHAGRAYSVSVQRYDEHAEPTSDAITVLRDARAHPDVALIQTRQDDLRVFWNEVHGDARFIVSAPVSTRGAVGANQIEYWSLGPRQEALRNLDALALTNAAHLIIWSTPPLGPSQPGRLQYTIGGPASQERSSASANP
jgi:subtilisin family serine protease